MNPKLRRKQRLHNLFITVYGLVIFVALLLATMTYANWGAVSNEVVYAFRSHPTPSTSVTVSPTPSPTSTPTPIVEPAHIIIEKIGVDTPIQWDIPADKTLDALNHGVAHLEGSAHLGEVGNVFITGHSSDYAWKKNPYAAVFSLVPKLVPGDIITIRENGGVYVYKVAQTKIVKPTEVEVANPTTTPILTLLTCYPVGTSRDRFIVHASLISSPQKPVDKNHYQDFTVPPIKFR